MATPHARTHARTRYHTFGNTGPYTLENANTAPPGCRYKLFALNMLYLLTITVMTRNQDRLSLSRLNSVVGNNQ